MNDERKTQTPTESSRVEELAVQCFERLADEGDSVVEQVCRDHPGLIDRVRAALRQLQEAGLADDLEIDGGGGENRIGDYHLLHRLGVGGMGVVYLAEQREPVHRQVALKLNELGNILIERDESRQAVTAFERALAITESTLGAQHPTVGRRLNNLAAAKLKVGDREGARQALTRAVTLLQEALGPEHPSTVAAQANLASLDD